MAGKDYSLFIKQKIKQHKEDSIYFTKSQLITWLCARNKSMVNKMKRELLDSKQLVFTEKQEVIYEGKKEERYKCYFVYSNTRGRCYVIRFNDVIKVITVFPLGRTTLKKYRRRFK
jgi:hypothetical protein